MVDRLLNLHQKRSTYRPDSAIFEFVFDIICPRRLTSILLVGGLFSLPCFSPLPTVYQDYLACGFFGNFFKFMKWVFQKKPYEKLHLIVPFEIQVLFQTP